MNSLEFLLAIKVFYGVDTTTPTNKMRLDYLEKWVSQKQLRYGDIFAILQESFVPTSTNTFPTVAHINQILTEQIDRQATMITDSLFDCIGRFGTYARSSDIIAVTGELAWETIKAGYGGWFTFASQTNANQENLRVHVRNSIVARMKSQQVFTIQLPNLDTKKALENK